MFLTRQPISNIGRDVLRLATSTRSGGLQVPSTGQSRSWTCWECQSSNLWGRRAGQGRVRGEWLSQRKISYTARRSNGRSGEPQQSQESMPVTPLIATVPGTPASSSSSLPSHTANRRSDYSKRASKILDSLLARASIASQHINAYTGTDYSGIEALRREIIEQEKKVKRLHTSVDDAKAKHHDAHAIQTSAQREIVGLLERKSSWSPSDLERYMSLVRSEHLNEQDVQIAKEDLAAVERDLEEARSLMERLERKQYHEEQVWSDTIRRNSTWVTFGLMGVNILLLLAQIAIFEPYRRKKIVKDVKMALDEKTLTAAPTALDVEQQVDGAITPEATTSEQAVEELKQPLDIITPGSKEDAGKPHISSGALPGSYATEPMNAAPSSELPFPQSSDRRGTQPPAFVHNLSTRWMLIQESFWDLFSERQVQLRKADVTYAGLQGAASGAALTCALLLLLQAR